MPRRRARGWDLLSNRREECNGVAHFCTYRFTSVKNFGFIPTIVDLSSFPSLLSSNRATIFVTFVSSESALLEFDGTPNAAMFANLAVGLGRGPRPAATIKMGSFIDTSQQESPSKRIRILQYRKYHALTISITVEQ